MTAEHFVPQKWDQDRANDYSNCYLCCTRCNSSRGSRPIEHPEGRLLDPCDVAWRERFRFADGFELTAKSKDDRDAERTLRVYDLNDPQKVARRSKRFQAIHEARALYRRTLEISELLDSSHPSFSRCLRILREQQEQAMRHLRSWRAIPEDSPDSCSCIREDARSLPQWLDRQCMELTSN